jgi:molybdopterin-guanine dinucleotide biosynthesis protein A
MEKKMRQGETLAAGVILAGGRSRRMGRNKALMRLGDAAIIEHVIRLMRRVTADVLIISNTPDLYQPFGLPVYTDIITEAGALSGLHAGLTYARYDAVVCVGCDMPLLQPELLSYLVEIAGEYDAVVPYINEADEAAPIFQTLSAVYSKRCLPVVNQMLAEGELRLHALYKRISVRTVSPEEWRVFDPHGLSFFNINTPEDFEKALGYFRARSVEPGARNKGKTESGKVGK